MASIEEDWADIGFSSVESKPGLSCAPCREEQEEHEIKVLALGSDEKFYRNLKRE
jgi:hypothetical protein